MRVGLLWFDNNPKQELDVKIIGAAEYYQKKYGSAPNVCFVHPSMLSAKTKPISGIEVRGNQSVLPNHFWIGIDNG